mmetsp:Transcript_10494/g.9493  ORF Transcript_10494/g.9493 Transcript_10494/m.9493 type:complete len:106 (+) Transcript_10494:1-318(+)
MTKSKEQQIMFERPSTAPININELKEDECGQNMESVEIKTASHPNKASIIPEQVSSTLEHIVAQLSIVSQTLSVFEERLSMHEDRMNRMENLMQSFIEKATEKQQ